ncbi:MAG: hypothetical protein Q9218_000415 [Villophora microphyllina]
MEAQVTAAEAASSTECSSTTEKLEEVVEAQDPAVKADASSDSASSNDANEPRQGLTTPRSSVSSMDSEVAAVITQISVIIASSNDRDAYTILPPFLNLPPEDRFTIAGFTAAEHAELMRRVADSPRLMLREVVGDYIMSEEFRHIPFDWTLWEMLNYVIENDIILPTEEEMNGDREDNARLCQEAYKIPVASEIKDEEDDEQLMRELAWKREHPGYPYPRDDLWEIGQPRERVFYRDEATGKWKKRFPVYDPANPRNFVAKTAPEAEAITGAVEAKEAEADKGIIGKETEDGEIKGKEKEKGKVVVVEEEEEEETSLVEGAAEMSLVEGAVEMGESVLTGSSVVTNDDDVLENGEDKAIDA